MKNYPAHYASLSKTVNKLNDKIPSTIEGFSMLHNHAISAGALSTKVKELVALAIAIAVRCDGCIAFHVHDALSTGATREEIEEILGVAILMGGGPALMYACEAYEALNQFEETMNLSSKEKK